MKGENVMRKTAMNRMNRCSCACCQCACFVMSFSDMSSKCGSLNWSDKTAFDRGHSSEFPGFFYFAAELKILTN